MRDEPQILVARHRLLQEFYQWSVVPRRSGWNGRRHHGLMKLPNDLLDGIAPGQAPSNLLGCRLLTRGLLHLLLKFSQLSLNLDIRAKQA